METMKYILVGTDHGKTSLVRALTAGGAEDGLLGDGHALEDEQFLGIDGLGDEVGAEAGNLLDVFEADNGEAGGGEGSGNERPPPRTANRISKSG
jgi:hypothetical protein